MTNMWSDKKWVNVAMNVLLFLLAINFMHYGQFTLPIMCLIMFIDNKFKFKVNSWFTFFILCLFAFTFCLFSYKLGFYCVMGFCLPMAYYIGSNLKETNEDNIKKIIYIIVFGMAFHALLNFITDITIYKNEFYFHTSRYDVWTKEEISPTLTSSNMVLLFSIFYYVLCCEKNNGIKALAISLFIILNIYNLIIGRRTPILMEIIIFVLSIFVMLVMNKQINKKSMRIISISLLAIIVVVFVVIEYMPFMLIFAKFKNEGFSSGRLQILFDAIGYMPKYLFGGNNISNVLGVEIHDLLFNIYDYAGVFAFAFMLVYCLLTLKEIYLFIIKKANINNILLYVEIFLCIIFEMILEPVMTGLSIFLICSIIIESSIERIK